MDCSNKECRRDASVLLTKSVQSEFGLWFCSHCTAKVLQVSNPKSFGDDRVRRKGKA